MLPKNALYTIPASRSFSDTLAEWVLAKYGSNPMALSRVLMLLPSRRACMGLRDAFLRVSDGQPLLLPRMQPIGDVDEDVLILSGKWQAASGRMPTPAFAFRRLFILAEMIIKVTKSRLDHALKLAAELARLFDELEREQVSLERLVDIVPEEFATHWQVTVEFLKILSEHWPRISEEEGIVSPLSCRNAALAALAQEWRENPPAHPVIVAGTTGSIPATAELIATVAQMPDGMVVLPALDNTADKKYLDNVTEGHAQWGMLRLLKKLKVDIGEVQELNGKLQVTGFRERTRLLSEIMRPAEVSEGWQSVELDMQKALSGVKKSICADIQEEAGVIALILREALEHPGKTAALITHDRQLARRVSAQMKRFGVTIDDSAGVPLMETPIATFLRLVAEVATCSVEAMPVSLLSLLKHPLMQAGMTRIECLEAARDYEQQVLRHPRKVENGKWQLTDGYRVSAQVKKLAQSLEHIFTPFVQVLERYPSLAPQHLPEVITAHLQCAEALSGKALWDGAEADAVTQLLSELQSVKPDGADVAQVSSGKIYSCYKEVFDILFSGKVFRPEYGGHPRLKILSPIEARMQVFDFVILGGLNEGSWPQNAGFDPWLNRKMREDIGLPALERAVGLAAHDFYSLANAPSLHLTRSEKINGTPTTPSRWLVKLDVLLAKFSLQNAIGDEHWIKLAAMLEQPAETLEIPHPEPRPPLEARPKSLSVTQVETWVRNPYAIYASQVLRLRLLEPIGRELNGSDFGNAVHKALEGFVNEYPGVLPADAYDKLVEYAHKALAPFLSNDRVKSLWWPRFMRIAGFIIEQENTRRMGINEVRSEASENCAVGDFTLTGRADRIEHNNDGSITIIDYKTGTLPTNSAIESGLSSQLVLLGLIMQSKSSIIKSLEYWQLQGGADAGKIKVLPQEKIADYISAAKEGLENLIRQYSNPDFPYRSTPFPARVGPYNDYAHLARIKEWQG